MKTMANNWLFVTIVLVGYFFLSTAYRKDVIDYWNKGEDVEEYKENGRSCGECHFPFQHNDEYYYACMENEEEQLVCKASNDTFIPCPPKCPQGNAFVWKVVPTSGPIDETVILECFGQGSPNPKITWKKDGIVLKEVDPPEDPYPTNLSDSISLEYSPDDYGSYSCHMENSYSSDSSDNRYGLGTYKFQGRRLPVPPTNLTVEEIYRTYVTFQWEHEDSGKRRKSFDIYLVPGRYPHEELTVVLIKEKTYTVKHLQPGVTYTAKVRRKTERGWSRYSNTVNFLIPAHAQEDGPVNVTIQEVTPTSVSLSWDWDGDLSDGSEPYILVYYYWDSSNGTKEEGSGYVSGAMEYTFKDLIPNTEYTFTVAGTVLPRLKDTYALPVKVKTPPQAPDIYDVQVNDKDHTHIIVICKAKGGPLPTVTWHRGNEDISTTGKINITSDVKTVTSILTLPRTADNYQKYECRAESSEGTDKWAVRVEYTGKHPPVALENMMVELTQKLDAMAEDMEKMKRDMDTLLIRSLGNK